MFCVVFKIFVSSVSMKVRPGHLVAVVGQVGAGKSSLIQALLGEMEKHRGHVLLKVCRLCLFVGL